MQVSPAGVDVTDLGMQASLADIAGGVMDVAQNSAGGVLEHLQMAQHAVGGAAQHTWEAAVDYGWGMVDAARALTMGGEYQHQPEQPHMRTTAAASAGGAGGSGEQWRGVPVAGGAQQGAGGSGAHASHMQSLGQATAYTPARVAQSVGEAGHDAYRRAADKVKSTAGQVADKVQRARAERQQAERQAGGGGGGYAGGGLGVVNLEGA